MNTQKPPSENDKRENEIRAIVLCHNANAHARLPQFNDKILHYVTAAWKVVVKLRHSHNSRLRPMTLLLSAMLIVDMLTSRCGKTHENSEVFVCVCVRAQSCDKPK